MDVKKSLKDILVVEDHAIIQRLYQLTLSSTTYSFNLVTTGKSALEALTKTEYRLILLDLGLPDMSGLKICERIRRDQSLGHCNTPVLMLSVMENSTKKKCLNAGANDFLVKTVVGTKEFQEIIIDYLQKI